MEIKINFSNTEHKDLISYCNLNDLLVSSVVKDSFTTGFNIERYGLLNVNQEVKEKEVIKEVIKYVEIPVVEEKEVIRIEYVEVPVEKIVYITDQEEIKLKIFQKEQEFDEERRLFSTKVQEMENIFQNEKKELFGKIEQLESKEPEIKEVIKEVFVTNLDNICDKPEPEIKEVIVEKIIEVIKEVPVEKVVEKIVEITKEVPIERVVEKIVEVIREVPVEKVVVQEVIKEVPIEKVVYITDQEEMKSKIFQKEQEFDQQRRLFSTKTQEIENIFQNEKNELLLKIQQLELKEPEVREVIKEVEVIKEIEKIIEVPVEVIREVIIEKEVGGGDKSKLDALQVTIQKIRSENLEKDRLIKEYEKTIQEIQEFKDGKRAVYLSGSNLNKTL